MPKQRILVLQQHASHIRNQLIASRFFTKHFIVICRETPFSVEIGQLTVVHT
jgi:hypothetical protein